MAGRGTSPTVIGRAAELGVLAGSVAAAADGQSRIVLVAGDAGIGKTRLVAEACARAERDGVLTAVGGCVQLGESSVAYAPLVQALRGLRHRVGEGSFTELLGPAEPAVNALLGLDSTTGASPGAIFELLLGVLRRLGERQPTVVVFEDLHWADPSTRDLVAFLGRNLEDARVVLVLTYRLDEMHRRHPWLPVLAELERDPRVERIALSGLGRPDVAELLGHLGGEAAVSVDELAERTGGNPFYLEELVAAAGFGDRLPPTLAEVILGRVRSLPEPVPAVLREASVLGDVIDDEWLADLTGRPSGEVAEVLREAVSRHLLVLDGVACRFRHALVREALYDDLLPGERERLHAAAAQRLLQPTKLSEQTRQTLLAYHALAAGDLPAAFGASVQAGLECESAFALAGAGAHFERALALWDRVAEPAAAAGMTLSELNLRAADVLAFSSYSPRAVSLADAALAALPSDASPEQRVIVLERIGGFNLNLQRPAAALAAWQSAVALVADRPASEEKALALSAYGTYLFVHARTREAEPVLREAITTAEEVGAAAVRMAALARLASVLVYSGRPEEGISMGDEALRLALEHGSAEDVCRAYTNQSDSLLISGHLAEAERLAADGVTYALQTGRQGFRATICNHNRICAMYSAGRWHEAERVEAHFVTQGHPDGGAAHAGWVNVLLGRGRVAEASTIVHNLLEFSASAHDVQYRAANLMVAGELAELECRWDEARDLLDQALTLARDTDDQYYSSHAFASALRVERRRVESLAGHRADAEVRHAREVADERIGQARDLAARLAALGIGLLPEPAAWLRTAEAEHASIYGTATADTWSEVAAMWEAIGQPYPAAAARYRYADALLREHGDRDQIRAAAAAALAVAEQLGAAPLAAEIQLLAQRGRLNLELTRAAEQPPPETDRLGLTAREAEVLALLSQGRTNREIGRALFISEKTASVHVSNLLRKLGAANRVEAAAISQRLTPADPRTVPDGR